MDIQVRLVTDVKGRSLSDLKAITDVARDFAKGLNHRVDALFTKVEIYVYDPTTERAVSETHIVANEDKGESGARKREANSNAT